MGKPSIFSRQYEKKMRRRRRNAIIISLAIVLLISALIIKVVCNPIDYTNIKKNIQAWIDSDNTNSLEENKVNNEEMVDEGKGAKEKVDEEPEKPIEEYISITLASGNSAKAIYAEDNDGGKVFKDLNTTDKGVSFDISQSGKQMLVTDTNLVITLYNIDGTSKMISKDQYISTSGSVFTKEAAIQTNPGYLWNVNPKFVGEEKVIFITNRPYFGGSNLKQYVWMTDIQTGEDKIFWELAGSSIEIGEREEKGIKVTVDGKIYYIDVNGNYIQ